MVKKERGFFCKISLPNINKKMNVLITNNHIIDETIINQKIEIKINDELKGLELDNRIKYTNEK